MLYIKMINITEDVLKAAAGNEGSSKEVITFLLGTRHEDVVNNLTEAVCFIAAAGGQLGVLELVSRHQGLLLCQAEWFGIATLYNAAKCGDLDTLQQLLCQGVNPSVKNVRNESPLWIAASRGHLEVVKCLVQRSDVDINSRSSLGRPPIFCPSADGDMPIVEILVGAGAITDIQDVDGETAISMAKKNGYSQIVHLLEHSIQRSIRSREHWYSRMASFTVIPFVYIIP
ncbi:ankyrin repeat-containing domain protein [Hypoxylon argillaceum]|nr:ankyrin repeat-containing domain protein [Hypoxylon argillaceum]